MKNKRFMKTLLDGETISLLLLGSMFIVAFGVVTIGLSHYPFIGIIISYFGGAIGVFGVILALLRVLLSIPKRQN